MCNLILISGKRWAHGATPRGESTRHCVVNGELRPAEGMDPSSAELLTTTATTGVGRKRQSQSGFGTAASSNRNEEEREQRDMREGLGQNLHKVHSSTDSPPGSEAHVQHWQPQLPRESSLSSSSTPAPNTFGVCGGGRPLQRQQTHPSWDMCRRHPGAPNGATVGRQLSRASGSGSWPPPPSPHRASRSTPSTPASDAPTTPTAPPPPLH